MASDSSKNKRMIIYNITFSIFKEIEDDWLSWIQETYIPSFLDCGCFTQARLTKITLKTEIDGPNYSLQLTAATPEDLNRFKKENEMELRNLAYKKFPNQLADFTTELQLIKDFLAKSQSN